MRAPHRKPAFTTYLFFGALFACVVFVAHAAVLKLPYYWDELGQFVPAALDLYHDGSWVPHSTLPNIHPPGVMAYLALVWRAFGYSILITRFAMLALASVALLTVFLLAIQLCRTYPGAPAFPAVILLAASPLFYSQSMLAMLDMPAMLFTMLALLLFLQEKYTASAAACVALVLTKETGLLVPLILGGWLMREKRLREAAYFAAPFLALGGWLLYLRHVSGSLFGNREFQQYNLFYPLHPVRLSLALIRRFYYVFIEDFHWIGTLAIIIAWRRTPIFRDRSWKIAITFLAGHLLLVSVTGGATLERYVLPVLPLFYIAAAAACSTQTPIIRRTIVFLMTIGLIASLWWNPPWPFPLENNLAFTDFIRVQKDAAEYVAWNYSSRTIYSVWPFTDEVRRPEMGYVPARMKAVGIPNFHLSSIASLKDKNVDVLVVYSQTWEPHTSVMRIEWIRTLLARYYGYEPQVTTGDIERELGLHSVALFERRGQWVEVYARSAGGPAVVRAMIRSFS
jgi:hypothetical protein